MSKILVTKYNFLLKQMLNTNISANIVYRRYFQFLQKVMVPRLYFCKEGRRAICNEA